MAKFHHAASKDTSKETSKEQKLLKAFSVIFIISAVLYLLFAVVCGASYAMLNTMSADEYNAFLAMSGSSTEALVNSDPQTMATQSMIAALTSAVAFVFSVAMGITGIRAARKPRKTKAFIVVAALYILVDIISFVWSIVALGVGSDMFTIAASVAGMFFLVLALYAGIKIRKNYEAGTITEDIASEKSDLGFIAVIYALMIVHVLVSIVVLMFMLRSNHEIDYYMVLDLGNIVFEGVAVWLIYQRSRATRPWLIAVSTLDIVATTIYMIISGAFSAMGVLESQLVNIFLLLYFLFAKRPRIALTQPFNINLASNTHESDKELFQPKTWPFWRDQIIFFCIFCVVGHWMEAGFLTGVKYGIFPGIYDPNSHIWSDWLYPFPIYGIGMCACGVVLFPIKNWLQDHLPNNWTALAASFVVNTLMCTAIELAMGLTMNQPVNGVYPYWDYSTMFMNFQGQICLFNSLAFGFVATLITWAVYPLLVRLLKRLSEDMNNVVFVTTVVFFAVLFSLYVINLGNL